jgi:hypothetical protein
MARPNCVLAADDLLAAGDGMQGFMGALSTIVSGAPQERAETEMAAIIKDGLSPAFI